MTTTTDKKKKNDDMLLKYTDTLYDRIAAPIKELHGALPVQEYDYAWQDNGASILAVAHCDYVNVSGLSDRKGGYIRDKHIVLSPKLDDRLGVWLILDVLPKLGLKFDVLLTTDEEIGQSTAQYFERKKYNWVFSFDRRGTDAVTYDYRCMDKAVDKHFKLGRGSFSDICSLDQPGVNVGTGYYDEHTSTCYANLRHTGKQVKRFLKFYHEFKDTKFEHVEYVKPGKLIKLKLNKSFKDMTYREREIYWDRCQEERRQQDRELQQREERWERAIAYERLQEDGDSYNGLWQEEDDDYGDTYYKFGN